MNTKKMFGIVEVAIIIVVTALISGIASGVIISHGNSKYIYTDLSDNEPIKEFLETYASIITDYYQEVDEKELINNAINGMLSYLGDDYTTYMSESARKDLNDRLTGEYEGIGIELSSEKNQESGLFKNIISSVFENSPAKEAGLLIGDSIIKVNGEDVKDKNTTEIVNLIKKDKAAPIKLTILREEIEKEFTLQIKKITLPTVSHKIIEENNKKVGYLYIESFAANTTNQVEASLKEMEKENIASLIIDVRNNTGGYLTTAKEIANLFLEKGKIIYSLEEKSKLETVKDNTDTKRTYPIVILINKSSASASEILAGALEDSYGATLVGETSFGKGKVQQTRDLDTGGMVKYTSAKWLTPKGNCIDGIGLKPKTEYEIKPDYSLQPKNEEDENFENDYEKFKEHLIEIAEKQYNKAVEILSN